MDKHCSTTKYVVKTRADIISQMTNRVVFCSFIKSRQRDETGTRDWGNERQ